MQHQPWLDRRPGMTMGPYGVHWERTQTWWRWCRAYHQYLARCQFMLRQGRPWRTSATWRPKVRRTCFAPAVGARRRVRRPARLQLRRLCAEVLLATATVEQGRIVFPRRIGLPAAGTAGLRDDDPCPAPSHRRTRSGRSHRRRQSARSFAQPERLPAVRHADPRHRPTCVG